MLVPIFQAKELRFGGQLAQESQRKSVSELRQEPRMLDEHFHFSAPTSSLEDGGNYMHYHHKDLVRMG